MSSQKTLEELEQQVGQLPPQEQLKLMACISEKLSNMHIVKSREMSEESLQQRENETDMLLMLCDEAAEAWEGSFDAAEEIRQMRQDRDEGLRKLSV